MDKANGENKKHPASQVHFLLQKNTGNDERQIMTSKEVMTLALFSCHQPTAEDDDPKKSIPYVLFGIATGMATVMNNVYLDLRKPISSPQFCRTKSARDRMLIDMGALKRVKKVAPFYDGDCVISFGHCVQII